MQVYCNEVSGNKIYWGNIHDHAIQRSCIVHLYMHKKTYELFNQSCMSTSICNRLFKKCVNQCVDMLKKIPSEQFWCVIFWYKTYVRRCNKKRTRAFDGNPSNIFHAHKRKKIKNLRWQGNHQDNTEHKAYHNG